MRYRPFAAGPLIGLLLLAACTPEPTYSPPPALNVYRFPWLEECKAELEARFAQERSRNAAFNYALISFSQSLKPVTGLRGYVELSSREYAVEALGSVAQGVIDTCYPMTSRKIALRDRKLYTKLKQTRLLASGLGAKKVYARLSPDHLHLYFPGGKAPAQ